MNKVLITGASGNVGLEVIRALNAISPETPIRAGVRNPQKDSKLLLPFTSDIPAFDFYNKATFGPALAGCQSLFLLRPPQITDVTASFKPLIQEAVQMGVQHIVFLSVQGAGKNPFIPHHKIENLVRESGLAYTFLRPAYFMQNFTTTLLSGIKQKREIYLPAGKAKFTLVDVRDIGLVAAEILRAPAAYLNSAFDLTSTDLLDFSEMAAAIGRAAQTPVQFISPDPISFFIRKRKEGVPAAFILVMILLHFLPRFQKVPDRTNCIQQITGRPPVVFEQFVTDYRSMFL